MKTTLLFLCVFLTTSLFGQYTQIPDPAFEQILIDEGYDLTLDGQVFTSLIEPVTYLDLSNSGVIDLTGIEDFTSLNGLNLSSTSISDLSHLEPLSIGFVSLVNTPLVQNASLPNVSQIELGGIFFNSMNQFVNLGDQQLIRLK